LARVLPSRTFVGGGDAFQWALDDAAAVPLVQMASSGVAMPSDRISRQPTGVHVSQRFTSGRLSLAAWRRLCWLVLVTPMALLLPLVYASPADPLWIGGVYDGADYDDIVAAAIAEEGILLEEPFLCDDLALLVFGPVHEDGAERVAQAPLRAFSARAPPF